MTESLEFRCNICGKRTRCEASRLQREVASCDFCRSTVRLRSLIHQLALEMFHVPLALPDFPRLKSIRGIGMSDVGQYSEVLQEKFDYRNTFLDHAPRFDLMNPPESELGQYDFVIVSDVLEHVPPPAETGFRNVYNLLKPGGVVILTVPYSIEDAGTIEHFSNLGDFSITDVGGHPILVNRTPEGQLQVFDNLVFHLGVTRSLEMREFSEQGLNQLLAAAGFDEVRFHGEEYLEFGIQWNEPWALPMTLHKGRHCFEAATIAELMGELVDAKAEVDRLAQRRLYKLGGSWGLVRL